MAILVICQDSPNAAALREQYLQAHFRYIESIIDKISIAGPIGQSDSARESDSYDGSCFIYTTNDLAEAQQLFANDPYALSGVYASFTFSNFLPAAGKWIGGTRW